ncbi:hypothetical protein HDU77_009749 [Chytriomyces hyalinus]|nr:hypothetical protein HDU77_009749 [Chytriomyces hyalinus]
MRIQVGVTPDFSHQQTIFRTSYLPAFPVNNNREPTTQEVEVAPTSSTTTVKVEPLGEASSEVTITATISLQTQPCATVESPVQVPNGFKNDPTGEKPPSVKRSSSSASGKMLDAGQVHVPSTPVKSALKQTRNTCQNIEASLFPLLHEQLRPTTPVPADSANNEPEKCNQAKATFLRLKSQKEPKTPAKPIPFEEDDLVSGFADLHVDRNKSHRKSNNLSQSPSPHSVRVQDPSGRATVYDNIHFPAAYINKIQSQQPHLSCTIQTSPSARPPTEWNGSGSNEFDSDDEMPVRYSVDRSMSSRPDRIHLLTHTPSPNKVVVDYGNGVQLEYDNIHYPARYMEKIRQNNPRARCWVERN